MDNRHLPLEKETVVVSLLGILLCLFLGGAVQAQDLIWVKRAGGGFSDTSFDIAVDAFGNSYVIGHFLGSATFGEGDTNETILSNVGALDVFVVKYDINGTLMWAKQVGGSELVQGFGIIVDASGNSHVTGVFDGVVTFGVGETNETTLTRSGSMNLHDTFVARYNANGTLMWAVRSPPKLLWRFIICAVN